MKRKSIFFLIVFFIINLFSFSNETNQLVQNEKLIKGKLRNGLEYYIFKNGKPENRATLNLVVKAGSLLENGDEQGLAHFLEHMAFNGTTKYEKNDLIKYLQSLGLSFGGDLNAYTSFEETVYTLKVPTTKKDLEVGIDVLREWSSEITFDPKEVEKEKNIIIEEWRLRQGLRQRVGDIESEILYRDSRYLIRKPIGILETIKGATSEKLKKFYETWYQPKNMSIVAVGDFNEKEIENLITTTFNNLKNLGATENNPASNFKREHVPYAIPSDKKNFVKIFTDPEITKTTLDIIWKNDNSPINTEENYKKYLIKQLLNSIVNLRLSLLARDVNSPFTSASNYFFPLNHYTGIDALSISIKNDKISESLEIVMDNLKAISINGISDDELKKEKLNFLNTFKLTLNNENSITNDSYANEIVRLVLENEAFMSPSSQYDVMEKLFKNISSKDLQDEMNEILKLKYNILVVSREDLKEKLISEKKLETLMDSLLAKTTSSISLENKNYELKKLNLKSGSTNFVSDEKDYKKFKLSNGLEVFYKKTDFDKDKIYFSLDKIQGSSSLDYSGYINSQFFDILLASGVGNIDYKGMDSYFKGKNFSVYPFIESYTQGFMILTNNDNLDESLNFFRTIIEEPKFDKNIIELFLKNSEENIKNRATSPTFDFSKKYLETLNSNHPRRKYLELEDLKYVTPENLQKTFKNLYGNFNNYKITVIGSIDEKILIDKLNKYFANLPVTTENISYTDLEVSYPKENIRETIVKGIDKKARVRLSFPYKGKVSNENKMLYNGVSSLLDILLIEDVREKIGGVYSIGSYTSLDKMNFNENSLEISFSTDPSKVDEIISAVKDTIKKIQLGEFSKEKIDSIKKNYELEYETSKKTNSFWGAYLKKKALLQDNILFTPTLYNETINSNSIKEFSNKAIDLNNVIEIILLPEKES